MPDGGWSGPGGSDRMPSAGIGLAALYVAIGLLLLVAGGVAIWIVVELLTTLTHLT